MKFDEMINQVITGDCLEVMKDIPDKSIDLVLTDPFYGSSGRDGSVHLNNDDVFGNRMSIDSFIWFVRSYSEQLFRITKKNSHCYIFSDWRKYKDVQVAFETNGWELRSLIVWNKHNGMGEYWRSSHEFILFFTKSTPKKLTHGGCMNVVDFKPIRGKNKVHSCEKPCDLMEYFIKASSIENDIVIDSFSGAGVTGIACQKLKRRFILIEKEPKYVAIAKERLRILDMQPRLL